MFPAIDLAELDVPDIIEELDFEVIFKGILDDFLVRYPEHTAPVESDPGYKILETAAYREMATRQRINDAVRAVMLATSKGNDLDNTFPVWVKRQTIIEAVPDAVPPVDAVYEDDESLRKRKQLALESYTSAGSIGAYTFFALSASPLVKDVSIAQPTGGTVLCSVLSREGDGSASTDLIDLVQNALSAEDVRPLNDTLITQSADIVNYTIEATLTFFAGPDKSVVLANAQQAVEQYAQDQHNKGRHITISGIHGALHQAGVQNVDLSSPATDLLISNLQAPFCTQITINDGGIYE